MSVQHVEGFLVGALITGCLCAMIAFIVYESTSTNFQPCKDPDTTINRY